jgi:tetraacyldisaccharide 4'-kinase
MLLKSFRYLLLPFSLIYGAIIWFRNWLFDKKYFRSATFNFPIICVGNLAVGGTGKTPMAEYLISFLKNNYKTATLSRGYKRKTTGFAIANDNTTALEIGDEPMLFHQKFPDITVAVGESRLEAIPQLLQERPETELIILDDAFQHRSVNAGLNIVLTEHSNLYTRDFMLPAGDLRDVRTSIKRADIIVVTKCEPGITLREKKRLLRELKPLDKQFVFFTKIEYAQPYHLFTKEETTINFNDTVLLICGIANPRQLKEYLTIKVHSYEMLRYPDHHIFDMDDLDEIKKEFSKISVIDKLILTTEKDAVRLLKFEPELRHYPIYVLPIQHAFLFDESALFEKTVTGFISSFKKNDL